MKKSIAAALVLLGLLAGAGLDRVLAPRAAAQPPPAPIVPTLEYTVVRQSTFQVDQPSLQRTIEVMAAEDWRFVEAEIYYSPTLGGEESFLFFERSVPAPPLGEAEDTE